MEFAGKLAVVTGAARGIGREVAAMLAAGGATVVLADRDGGAVEAAAAALRDAGGKAVACEVDLTREDECARMRSAVDGLGGRLHVLVNNAGAWRYGSLREAPDDDFDWTFAVNTKTVWLSLRALADALIAAGDARVVNVASNAGFKPRPDLPLYAAAKAAVLSLTRSAALDFAPHGVLVNGVAPGPVATEPVRARYPDLSARASALPVGRIADPADLAEVIVFLASPRNRFMCGETVLVNGGVHMV